MTIREALELAASHHRSGDLQQAELVYRELSKVQPNNADIYNSLGNVLQDKRQLEEAVACYQKALELSPDFAGAYYNLGDALQDKGKFDEAIGCYRQAIRLDPNFAYAYNNLAIALKSKGQIDEAIICCKKAVELAPNLVEAIYNLGNALQDKGQLEEAMTCYDEVLRCDSTHVGAYTNLGNVFQSRGQLDKGEMCYRTAIRMAPNDVTPYQSLLMAMNYNPGHNIRGIVAEHLRFAGQHAEPIYSEIGFTNDRTITRRLKIGYVSPDFKRHSVAYFIEPVLASHNRELFEVFCYSNVLMPDEVTGRLRETADHWQDIVTISDERAAQLIRDHEIDILVDLAGHTASNRVLLFARKPAPVQVTWIGYPATTGLSSMDYKIVDKSTDPQGTTEEFYTEKLIRMPESFLCYLPDADNPEVGCLPSLAKGHISFGSFNNFAKITPRIIGLWTKILKAIPNSRLVLKAKSLSDRLTREYTFDMFTGGGIERQRIKLISWLPSMKDHLNLYNEVDISLDTFPYNGTTTTCEAMWMGVPVVTLAGRTHASRVGASLLSNVGLRELAARTPEEYVEIAVNLARDSKRLESLHNNLRCMVAHSPLTNAGQFTMDLEACYRRMWDNWCKSAV